MGGQKSGDGSIGEKDYQTAIHEAGHAVIEYHLGLTPWMVSIVPSARGSGRSTSENFFDQDADSFVAACMGGFAAELLVGCDDHGSWASAGDDRGLAGQALGLSVEECDQPKLQPWIDRATTILQDNRSSLIRVAEQLLLDKQLLGEEIDILIEEKEPHASLSRCRASPRRFAVMVPSTSTPRPPIHVEGDVSTLKAGHEARVRPRSQLALERAKQLGSEDAVVEVPGDAKFDRITVAVSVTANNEIVLSPFMGY